MVPVVAAGRLWLACTAALIRHRLKDDAEKHHNAS